MSDSRLRIGNWLYRHCFPLYNLTYTRFKHRQDRHEIALLKRLVSPGDHVLDIGANIGFYARILSGLVGEGGKVYCFEPEATNFGHLVKNTDGLRNVERLNIAVAENDGPLTLYTSKLLNVDHRTYPVRNYDSTEAIEGRSIDRMVGREIEKVDLIKIDIQGFELSAFRGMRNLLNGRDHLRILMEFWPHGFRRAGTDAVAVYDFLEELGYEFRLIEAGRLAPLTRDFVQDNNDRPFEFSCNVLIEKTRRAEQP